MAAFATPAELAGFLQVESVDTYSATQALDIASRAIRDHCGWSISQETITAKVIDSHGERSLWLPTLLLTAVGPVVVGGVTLTIGVDYDWTTYGRLIHVGRWPNQARSVTITYTHGHNPAPDSVKGACLVLSSGVYENPERLRSHSETVGGVSETKTYATASESVEHLRGFDPAAVMAKYKLEPPS